MTLRGVYCFEIIFYEWLCLLVSFLLLRKETTSALTFFQLFSNRCLECIFFVTSSHALVKCCSLKLFVSLAVLPKSFLVKLELFVSFALIPSLFLVKLKLFVSLALLPSSSTALFLVTEALFCVDLALFSSPECLFCELAESEAVVKFPSNDAFLPS